MSNENGEDDTLKNQGIIEPDTTSEFIEEVQEKLAKAEELALNQKIRAEKAERLAKSLKEKKDEEKPEAKAPTAGELSSKDLYALMEAHVPQEDIDEVREYAQLKKISIAEALKTSIVKSILSEKAEQRKSAEASNTGGSKRSSGKVTDEVLLAKAAKGEMPDSDEEIQRLYKLRKGLK